jgi:hypothetical protein
LVLLQVLAPVHQSVGTNLGSRVAAWLYDRLTEACVRPPGMGHLEDRELTSDRTVAREFDRGMTGPPMHVNMDFIAADPVETITGLACAAVLFGHAWWGPPVLAGAWLADPLAAAGERRLVRFELPLRDNGRRAGIRTRGRLEAPGLAAGAGRAQGGVTAAPGGGPCSSGRRMPPRRASRPDPDPPATGRLFGQGTAPSGGGLEAPLHSARLLRGQAGDPRRLASHRGGFAGGLGRQDPRGPGLPSSPHVA